MGFNTVQQYLLPFLKLRGRENDAFISLLLLYGVFLVSNIVSPKLINILRPKITLILGAITYVLFSLSIAADSRFILILSSILLGCGASFLWISSGQIITASSKKDELGKNLGFNLSALLLGSLLGVPVGILLTKIVSFEQFYLIFSGISALGILFFLPLKSSSQVNTSSKFEVKYFLKPQFLLLFPIVFASQFYIAQTFAAINLIVLGSFGLTFVGIFAFIFRISSITGSYAMGKISDQYNKLSVLFLLALTGLAGTLFFLSTSNLVLAIFGVFLLGIFTTGSFPVSLSVLKNSSSNQNFLYVLGSFNIISNLAVLTALLATKYLDVYQSFIPGIAFLLIALPFLIIYKNKYSN